MNEYEYEGFNIAVTRGEWILMVEADPKQKCPLAYLLKSLVDGGEVRVAEFIRRFDTPWVVRSINTEVDGAGIAMLTDSLAYLDVHHKYNAKPELDPETAKDLLRRMANRKTPEEMGSLSTITTNQERNAWRDAYFTGEIEGIRWALRILENSELFVLGES